MPDHVTAQIAVNGAFLTRRWEEPRNWIRLTRECGYTAHSFCGDVLDPFFSGDHGYQHETALAVRAACAEYGVSVCDYYTGVATHRFHGLSHRDHRVRKRMEQWIYEAADIAVAMGTDAIGGHWDAFSCERLADPADTQAAEEQLVSTFRRLGNDLAARGIRVLMQEQMYIPSEKPWTIAECSRFLADANCDRADGALVLATLDTGHQAGMHYGLAGPDLSYEEWLKAFAACTEVIHLQQTVADASAHWPFTPEFNARGHVDIDVVLRAIAESHRAYRHSSLAGVVPEARHHWLVVEVIPGSTHTEERVLRELTETCAYLRKWIPEPGLTLQV